MSAPPYNGLLNGDSQEDNADNGNGGLASNEKGFNMTISAVPGCVYPPSTDSFTVGQPLGKKAPVAWNCEAVLTNCYLECKWNFRFFLSFFLFDLEPETDAKLCLRFR